jgi:hypothetical protein
VQVQDGKSSWVLSFRRLLLEYEVEYSIEASADLRTWSPAKGEFGESLLNSDGVPPGLSSRRLTCRVKPQDWVA